MHSIKGGWVGQTFALAKNNESEGRKSRIRRSKEERKAMVESFIQKYQTLNNGSFPSLNLTHKEVGGSFYTVREIVRDIIQENRVLGPAKFTAEEQTIDQFLEHNPLGSIAAEPQSAFSMSFNESQFVSNQIHGTNNELVFSSDGHLVTFEHQNFGNGQIINGTQVEVNNKEFDELNSTEIQVTGPVETEKNVGEESVNSNGHVTGPGYQMFDNGLINGSQVDLKDKEAEELTGTELQTIESLEAEKTAEVVLATSRFKVTAIAEDVIVETFPLKTVNETSESLNGRLQEATDLTISTEDKGTTGIVDEKGSTDLNGKAPHKDVPTSEILEQSQLTAGAKAIKAPDSSQTKNSNGTGGSGELSKTKEALVTEDVADVQPSGSLQKGSNPTLDRINLESWEGASKKSAKHEGNPLWDVFKAFLDAFVKFWSE